jgi:hypothetical protein
LRTYTSNVWRQFVSIDRARRAGQVRFWHRAPVRCSAAIRHTMAQTAARQGGARARSCHAAALNAAALRLLTAVADSFFANAGSGRRWLAPAMPQRVDHLARVGNAAVIEEPIEPL